MDLGDWLRSLGLEKYEAAFRENEINEKVLPSLTAEDLKDLGVVIVGHRRMLLDAIALLRAEGRSSPYTPYARSRHRRASPSHRDVLGPCRLDGPLRPHGPGRPSRGHF